MWSHCDLNFGLLILKSNPFIPVPNCIKVVNFGEIVRCRVHKLLVHAHAHTQSRTLDSPKTECLLRLIASGDVNIIQHVQSPNNSEDDEYAVVLIHGLVPMCHMALASSVPANTAYYCFPKYHTL